ncbi:hypothetical protein MUY27_11495 [Mucilaginibacter sp. RS28]|uniref:Lipoprotein n=1 Tax=Mucilaginibacter straminoryzae TaxID=2932774 RepID=A0A9X1X835_9SPHI|nr:hypothetical protein [Mucilaginibacter straminoryzae]MCJ8210334.1 hypothetical protein [Mucilaginibacter straminoryzae]
MISRFFSSSSKLAAVCMPALLFIACEGHRPESSTGDTTSTANSAKAEALSGKMCFQKVSGLQGNDTLAVTLNINDGKVTGKMENVIYEKDSRRGTLEGTLNGNDINAVWKYMQEGAIDTLHVSFRLNGAELWQYPIKFNSKTNREQTDVMDTAWVKLQKVDCK